MSEPRGVGGSRSPSPVRKVFQEKRTPSEIKKKGLFRQKSSNTLYQVAGDCYHKGGSGSSLDHEGDDELLLSLFEGSEIEYFNLFSASKLGDDKTLQECLKTLDSKTINQMNPVPDSPDHGLNPLHVAKTVLVSEILLRAKIPIESRGFHGQTALHTHYGNPVVAEFLIQKGARIDAKTSTNGSTPLQWAVAANEFKTVKLLLAAGANVNHRNADGNTALHLACSVEVTKLLLAYGAETDIANNDDRLALEESALRANHESQYDVALAILEHSTKEFFARDLQRSVEIDTPGFEEFGMYEKRLESSTVSEQEEGSSSPYKAKELKIRHETELNAIKEQLYMGDVRQRARQKWNSVKKAFIKKGSHARKSFDRNTRNNFDRNNSKNRRISFLKSASKSRASSSSDHCSEDFHRAFFELMVRERPGLALKVLDTHRVFLYWENTTRVYRYDTSLLGTIPMSSSAVKQMVLDNQLELVSHPVAQFSLNTRWILFTREVLLFEFILHIVWLLIFVGTTLSKTRNIDFRSPFMKDGFFHEPSWNGFITVYWLICEIFVLFVNLRYIRIQIIQAKIASVVTENGFSLKELIHCKFRSEDWYLIVHLALLASQILRCFPAKDVMLLNIADVLCALISWRLFYRTLCFGECFEAIGVPMSIIKNMINRNMVYFGILFTIVTGFSHSMYLLYRTDPDSDQYGSLYMCWITLFFFAFNLDVDSLNDEPVLMRKYFGFLIIGLYMLLMVLVSMNLIIAVMTNIYEEISKNSRTEWMLQRAKMILYYEQYELAMNTDFFIVNPKQILASLRDNLNTHSEILYPPGPTKHYVKEETDGRTNIELPTQYIFDCKRFRQRKARWIHRIRYRLFYCWKKRIRRSPSFLWPENRLSNHRNRSSSGSPLGVTTGDGTQYNTIPSYSRSMLTKHTDVMKIGSFEIEERWLPSEYTDNKENDDNKCENCLKQMAKLQELTDDVKELQRLVKNVLNKE